MNATSIMARRNSDFRFVAQAKRYLLERDLLDDAKPEQIDQLAESFRHDGFMEATAPYRRQKEAVVSRWFSLQVMPYGAELPKEIKETLVLIDECIASVARDFGYAPNPEAVP